ncbi:MAG: DNA-processing protein DprA [Candidatus Omnitrophica bacterium]|nr:DNA-processing protein DprA [Candidatus Omnitrophota bacterium]
MALTQEIIELLSINLIKDVGFIRLNRLIEHFGSISEIFKAKKKDFSNIKGITLEIAEEISSFDKNEVEKQIKEIEKYNVSLLSVFDDKYPQILKNIYSPPIILFVRGNFLSDNDINVAIVGTRKASFYGMQTAEKLAYELGQLDITIVSGLASGIDSNAHKGALKAKAKTIGVLGCGVDICYPSSNKRLFSQMLEKGVIVSELSMGFKPNKNTFPMRNRIISGLSKGVVVVEAAKKSGSLITADLALEQGREVFAVPGRIDCSVARGTLELIKNGAKLVQYTDDILEEIGYERKKMDHENKNNELTESHKKILDMISKEPLYIDDIQEKLMCDFGTLNSILLQMQLTGLINESPGKVYSLK